MHFVFLAIRSVTRKRILQVPFPVLNAQLTIAFLFSSSHNLTIRSLNVKNLQGKLHAIKTAVEDCRKKVIRCGCNEEREREGEENVKRVRGEVRALGV